MAKTGAERQAHYRRRQKEENKQDEQTLLERLARIEEKLDRILIASIAASRNVTSDVTVTSRNKPTRASLTELPEDWELDDNLLEYTGKYGLDPEVTLEDFKNYWCGTGKRMRSWPRTYQRWVREQVKRNESEERKEKRYSNGKDNVHSELSISRKPTGPAPTLRDLGLE